MNRAAPAKLKVNPPLGSLPVLQYCPPDQLLIDPEYQRSLETPSSETLVRRIAAYWNWDLCQPLVVARRPDGKHYVVDGQHRHAAALLRADIWQLPCVVVSYESAEQEAAAFVALNQQRRPLSKLDLFKAALASGDGEARAIVAALEEAGLRVATSSNIMSLPPGAVSNVGGLEACYRSHGQRTLAAACKVLARAYPGEVLRYAGSIFPGIVALLVDQGRRADDETIARIATLVSALPQVRWYQRILAAVGEDHELSRRHAAVHVLRRAWIGRADPPATMPAIKAKAPLSFEEQLERVASGKAKVVENVRIRRPDPDQTLGGVGSAML